MLLLLMIGVALCNSVYQMHRDPTAVDQNINSWDDGNRHMNMLVLELKKDSDVHDRSKWSFENVQLLKELMDAFKVSVERGIGSILW